jgi:hypothetical protein
MPGRFRWRGGDRDGDRDGERARFLAGSPAMVAGCWLQWWIAGVQGRRLQALAVVMRDVCVWVVLWGRWLVCEFTIGISLFIYIGAWQEESDMWKE